MCKWQVNPLLTFKQKLSELVKGMIGQTRYCIVLISVKSLSSIMGFPYWLNQLTGVVCLKCKENSQFRKLSWVHMLLIYSCCNKNGAVCHRNDHYIPLWSLLNTLVPSHGWVFFMWYQQWQRMVERGEMFH